MKSVVRLLITVSLLYLQGCAASQPPAGQWKDLPFKALALAPVVLQKGAIEGGHPGVCREAPKEIARRLYKSLPARLAPVELAAADVTPTPKMGVLELRIERCFVDSDTAGMRDTPSFYLTLQSVVVLRHDKRVILQRRFKTDEAVYHPNTPTPDFEFTFSDPVRAVLRLFDKGRVLSDR